MYIEKLRLVNTGPIGQFEHLPQFDKDGLPKPIAFVGTNGAGKSILIAHIVSALAEAQSTIFDDAEVEKGKAYKLRSPAYIKNGASFSTAHLAFSGGFEVDEIQLLTQKKNITEKPDFPKWDEVPADKNNHYASNWHMNQAALREQLLASSLTYFPPNRFEQPAWLNESNLKGRADFFFRSGVYNVSDRDLVQQSPLRDIQSWLLDLIYDAFAIEKTRVAVIRKDKDGQSTQHIEDIRNGPASQVLIAIESFLRVFFEAEGTLSWHVGSRNRREIGFSIGEAVKVVNIFMLSTGQTAILNLFLSIIRDADFSDVPIAQLGDIKGISVIDEIDLHLHTGLQFNLLPKLMKLFPKIQFVVTTHSPLFLLGLQRNYGVEGFQIIELPHGHQIEAERFSEFEEAYQQYKATTRFETDLRSQLASATKPILYVEGETDMTYIRHAAKKLDKEELIDRFSVQDGEGHGNLTKIWKGYTPELAERLPYPIILLYDCDTNKNVEDKGQLKKRVLPYCTSKIGKGIENLFSEKTLRRAIGTKLGFVDVRGPRSDVIRGKQTDIPEQWSVNENEKMNLCNWICENGVEADFEPFNAVFDILQATLTDLSQD
ncbi:AAA family ATPase [Parasphingorhabdus sp.]|uniref:AAA family ATPase n=1 Tax=Parasphingorhabdus sp. TaxID=2709688 RepID=UPI003D2D261F